MPNKHIDPVVYRQVIDFANKGKSPTEEDLLLMNISRSTYYRTLERFKRTGGLTFDTSNKGRKPKDRSMSANPSAGPSSSAQQRFSPYPHPSLTSKNHLPVADENSIPDLPSMPDDPITLASAIASVVPQFTLSDLDVEDPASAASPTDGHAALMEAAGLAHHPPAPTWYSHLPEPRSQPGMVTVEELKEMMDDQQLQAGRDYVVVDVRRTDMDEKPSDVVLSSAINLPAQTFNQTLPITFNMLSHIPKVIFHCNSCSAKGRGPRCAAWYQDYLDDLGCVTSIALVLSGGFKAWRERWGDEGMVRLGPEDVQ